MSSFSFNGVKKSYVKELIGWKRPVFAPVTRNMISIPGRPGAVHQGTDVGIRAIEIPIYISGSDVTHFFDLKEDLARWLITDNPRDLVFDDEPDKIYSAFVEGSLDLDELLKSGKGSITFICPDPYSQSAQKTILFDADGSKTFVVDGSVKTFPIITAVFEEESSFFSAAVNGSEEYIMIGSPDKVTQTKKKEWTKVFEDNGNSLTGWINHNYVDDGMVAGAMGSSGNEFIATSYGTGTGFHGPIMKKSLTVPLKDFRVETVLNFQSYEKQDLGRVEIYLLDTNSTVLGKLSIRDVHSWVEDVFVEARAGDYNNGHSLFVTHGNQVGDFNDFLNGTMYIQRVGNKWEAYAAKYDYEKGVHTKKKLMYWYDTKNQFTNNLAQIAIHIGKYGNYPTYAKQNINWVRVYEWGDTTPDEISDVIFSPNDELIVDCIANKVYKNGYLIIDKIDPGHTFFGLKPGANTVATAPGTAADVSLKYRPRWL